MSESESGILSQLVLQNIILDCRRTIGESDRGPREQQLVLASLVL